MKQLDSTDHSKDPKFLMGYLDVGRHSEDPKLTQPETGNWSFHFFFSPHFFSVAICKLSSKSHTLLCSETFHKHRFLKLQICTINYRSNQKIQKMHGFSLNNRSSYHSSSTYPMLPFCAPPNPKASDDDDSISSQRATALTDK